MSYTPTFILTWNPDRFKWEGYENLVQLCRIGFIHHIDWSCRSKQPKYGDRFILLMQGQGKKNGIVASGDIESVTYDLPFADFGGRFLTIGVKKMWDYKKDSYIRTETLKAMFPEQNFAPQFSGIRVRSSILPDLWQLIERS